MIRYAAALMGLFALLFVVLPDVALNYGRWMAVVLSAGFATAFIFSMAGGPQTEVAMASAGGQVDQQSVEADTPVGKFKYLGDARGMVVFALAAMAYFGYLHHTSNEAALTRLFEAMTENTYVISLPQAEREKLNISMPESLRRKIRAREQ